jgi:hypothetical protein
MCPGPLPDPNARRRNKRKPGTPLPLAGPSGPTPKCPYALAKSGKKWWKWAWKLPQATAWDDGAVYFVARRAQLEDALAALDEPEDLVERIHNSMLRTLESDAPEDVPERLNYLGLLMAKLKALAGGRVTLLKEMREMDNKLGLNPKAFADLRWTLEVPDEEPAADKKATLGASVTRLRAVDAA